MTARAVLEITSTAFVHQGDIPAKYTCVGANVNPPLAIEGIPAEAQTMVLIVDDPDAPAGIWDHWIVYNIDPQTYIIDENSIPEDALQGTNDFEQANYGGPCPPPGPAHRYFFRLYALDTKLDLKARARRFEVEQAMEGHILAQAELVGRYQQ